MNEDTKTEINEYLDHNAPKWVNYILGGIIGGLSLITEAKTKIDENHDLYGLVFSIR